MAITATTHWQVGWGAGGSDTNGGGFDPGQTSGMLTNGAATAADTASPVLTSASYTFVAGDVNAWVYIASGTNWTPGWYKIASVNAGAATLSAAAGAAVLANRSISTAAGCATVASPTGATFAVDYSQATNPVLSLTDFACTSGGTTLTTATGGFTPVMVGNHVRMNSGTNYQPGNYRITAYGSGTSVTIDRTCTSGGDLSGGNGKVGGALGSPGMASGLVVAAGTVWAENNTYTITSTSQDVTNGRISIKSGSALSTPTRWIGHGQSTRAQRGISYRPIIQLQAALGTNQHVFQNTSASHICIDWIVVDPNGNGTARSFNLTPSNPALRSVSLRWCGINNSHASTAGGAGFGNGGGFGVTCFECDVQGTSAIGTAFDGCVCIGCYIKSPGSAGFANSVCYACVVDGGSTTTPFSNSLTINCVTYNTTGDAYDNAGSHAWHINSLAELSAAYGWDPSAANVPGGRINCAHFRCSSGEATYTQDLVEGHVAVSGSSGSVMVDPGNDDFSLDSTAGEGVLLRGTGYPGVGAVSTTTGKADIGFPTSATASAGGGGLLTHPGMAGGMRG